MGFKFLIFLCIAGGLEAGQDFRNQTLECSFEKIKICFSQIATLGGDFSAMYANNKELNQTCKHIGVFQSCVLSTPQLCNNQNPDLKPSIDSIVKFATKLCTNGSVEENNFLNSSVCYNQNQNRRKRCVQQHSASKLDAKSLCCSSKKTQDCLKNDLKNVCTSNSTNFQDRLIDTYSGFTNLLCAPYLQYCNGALTNFLSVACLLLTAKLTLLNFIS